VIPRTSSRRCDASCVLFDGDKDVHTELFLANFFAQTAALAFDKDSRGGACRSRVRRVPARVFCFATDRRRSAPVLTPSVVGQLIALAGTSPSRESVNFDQWASGFRQAVVANKADSRGRWRQRRVGKAEDSSARSPGDRLHRPGTRAVN